MQSSDGKFYKTDVAETEQIFSLFKQIQFTQTVEPTNIELQ